MLQFRSGAVATTPTKVNSEAGIRMLTVLRSVDRVLRDFFSRKPLGVRPRHFLPPLAGCTIALLAFSLLEHPVAGRVAAALLRPGALLADLGGWGGHDVAGFMCYTAGNMIFYAALASVFWGSIIYFRSRAGKA